MKFDKNVCFSGGAIGADLAWGKAAELIGHSVIHYSFADHNAEIKNIIKSRKHLIDGDLFKYPLNTNQFGIILNEKELLEADSILKLANKVLKRTFPTNSEHTNNLLRRNYHQVIDSNSVYAISALNGNSVYGGTAWAIEMFKILNTDSDKIYVFDQEKDKWFQWEFMYWKEITTPPRPSGKWTGIGTRGMMDNGHKAISNLFLD